MSVEKALHHIEVDGFYVMENVIPEEEAERIRKSVWETVAGGKDGSLSAPEGVDFQAGLIALVKEMRTCSPNMRACRGKCGAHGIS